MMKAAKKGSTLGQNNIGANLTVNQIFRAQGVILIIETKILFTFNFQRQNNMIYQHYLVDDENNNWTIWNLSVY